MDTKKVCEGARELLAFADDKLGHYDPAEKISALRSAADVIQQTLLGEHLKATMAETLRKIFEGPER